MIVNKNRLYPYILSVTFIFYGFFFVDNLPLSGPPDELAHASYIADAENSNSLIPNYKSGKIIGSEQLNFLSHPPLYYSIQAIFGKVFGISAEYDYKEFRVLSLIMVSIGFLFLLKAAKSLGLSDGFLLIITLGAMSVPNFIYIASSINNDNLVFLGVALMFFSMVKFYSTTASTRSWAIAGLYVSLLIIALGKVNAALFAIVFLISWLFLSRGKFFFEFFNNKLWIGLMLLSFILFGYFVYTYFLYGTFFPAPKYVYELKSPDNPISFLTYIKQFFVLFVTRFSGAYGHTSYLVYPGIFVYGLYFILFSPMLVYASVRFFVESVFVGNPVYRLFDAVL